MPHRKRAAEQMQMLYPAEISRRAITPAAHDDKSSQLQEPLKQEASIIAAIPIPADAFLQIKPFPFSALTTKQ